VSTTTQVAVLAPVGSDAPLRRRGAGEVTDRPAIRLVAFGALGLYGVLRWGTLMEPAPTWRLLGLLGVALVLAAVAPALLERERSVAAMRGKAEGLTTIGPWLALIAVLAAFPIAGVPLDWMTHLRVSVTANGIGEGLSTLPGILVPYNGINEWARVVIVLGAAVLLLDAAMLLAFAPPALGDIRRAGAALPLIALVVVPATLVHPSFPYLQGLLLFALLAFFMWGERVPVGRRGGVVLACAAAGAIGLVLAPAITQRSPWIDYEALTRGFTPPHVVRFNWAQRYGPLTWPRTGNTVLEVHAAPKAWGGEYWKTENLDTFDGTGWAEGEVADGPPLPGVSARTVTRYTQNLTVTIRGMSTTQVVAAGYASPPQHLSGTALPSDSVGTWMSSTPLVSGNAYTVQVYSPHPSGPSLAKAGEDYPAEVAQSDLAMTMPQNPPSDGVRAQSVVFPRFGSHGAPEDLTNPASFTGAAAIRSSPYWQAYTLAQSLAAKSKTPYAFVQRVMSYLTPANGYSYNEYPPVTADPLETFLFVNKIGYCQQFAGAMAMLLRMGGVPARVSTGFTTGVYDSTTKQWVVTDVDAHAWVEAWFPHYGWVTFDPTPASAPARGGHLGSISSSGSFLGPSTLGATKHVSLPANSSSGRFGGHGGDSTGVVLPIVLAVLAALLAGAYVAWRRTAPLGPEALLAELERAMARSGRPISDGVTLVAIERRFRTSPEAAAYVRAIRSARFAAGGESPTLGQRRALRAQLRAGLGFAGAVRALWALPPRPKRARGRAARRHKLGPHG
jgi:protein-glutamine gamma-glutamyltransferase